MKKWEKPEVNSVGVEKTKQQNTPADMYSVEGKCPKPKPDDSSHNPPIS